jgi:putative transposase
MKKFRYTKGQIVKALKEEGNCRSVNDISRELGINKQTFYNWMKKYAGISGEHLRQLKQLQEENVRLKQMYADVSLGNKMLKDVLPKKW